jgi:hypothetical protein
MRISVGTLVSARRSPGRCRTGHGWPGRPQRAQTAQKLGSEGTASPSKRGEIVAAHGKQRAALFLSIGARVRFAQVKDAGTRPGVGSISPHPGISGTMR